MPAIVRPQNDENLAPQEQVQQSPQQADRIIRLRKRSAKSMGNTGELEKGNAPASNKSPKAPSRRKNNGNSNRKVAQKPKPNCYPAIPGTSKNGMVYSDQFKFKINKNFREAVNGSIHGSFRYGCQKMGVPEKKFGKADVDEYGTKQDDWPIQALFKTERDGEYLVLYEGWAANTAHFQNSEELKNTASEMIKKCDEQISIIEAIEKCVGKKLKENIFDLSRKPSSSFWILQDMTFHQNEFRRERINDSVLYLSSQLNVVNVPNFIHTKRNMVERIGGSEIVLDNLHGKHIKELMKQFKIRNGRDPLSTSRSCSSTCKCHIRDLIYQTDKSNLQNAKRATYSADGRLELDMEKRNYIIECSDACGCDLRCPNRVVQGGQSIPLVVYYEDHEKGNVVRAAVDVQKGDFLSEYTGVIRPVSPHKSDRYSMEFGLLFDSCVVDAIEKGNVSRFYSHSCDPNAICIETHSRVSEDEPLIPRVGIFALRSIPKGEEVTISYYDQDTLDAVRKNGAKRLECMCNTVGCNKWIPRV